MVWVYQKIKSFRPAKDGLFIKIACMLSLLGSELAGCVLAPGRGFVVWCSHAKKGGAASMKMDREKTKANIIRWLERANDLQLRTIAMVVYLIVAAQK